MNPLPDEPKHDYSPTTLEGLKAIIKDKLADRPWCVGIQGKLAQKCSVFDLKSYTITRKYLI